MKMMMVGGGLFVDGCCEANMVFKRASEIVTKRVLYTQPYE